MYLLRVESMVAAGRVAEFEAWQERHAELRRSQPGYVRSLVLNSLGDPAKYVSLNWWESREAQLGFSGSEALKGFLQANPAAGIFTSGRPSEGYEPVLEVVREGPEATHVSLADWNITPGQGSAFEESRRLLYEIGQKHDPGFVDRRLYRFLGNPNRYLAVLSSNLPTWDTTPFAVPEIREWIRTHPENTYSATPYVPERCVVVQRFQA